MNKIFQMGVRSEIFLTMIFGAMVSVSQSFSSSLPTVVNPSFEREDNRLLQPIVIPNLTGLSEDFFTSAHKLRLESKVSKDEPKKFLQRQSGVIDRDQESSHDSEVRVPLIKEILKPEENASKFSSRYSSKPEVYGTILQNAKEGIHTRDIKDETERKDKDENEKTNESLEVPSLLGSVEKERDILPDNTVYPGNSERPSFPTLERSENELEQGPETDDYPDTKDAKNEQQTITTTSEPQIELQNSPSVDPWNDRYSDETEHENHEPSSEAFQQDDIASEEHDKEENRRSDDHGDSGRKNYHSVQTPLHKIQFMGPHDFKDDSDSNRLRTRPMNPIERDHVKYQWPYFKTQVKAKPEKVNEISNNGSERHGNEDSDDWRDEEISSKDLELNKAVEKDEARFGINSNPNEKYNFIQEKNHHFEKQKALIAEEEKDHERPLFKIINRNSEEQPQAIFGDKTVPKTNKHEKGIWTSGLPLTESSPKLLNDDGKLKNIEPTNFNISKELESDFQGLKFLSASVFNKNVEEEHPKTHEHSKALSKNIFLQELENKEMIDQKNLNQRKSKTLTGVTEISSQSFNHLEESDEMYNQILTNIQSVFGLRTQPLKSNNGRKRNEKPEVNLEENRSLTWSTSLLRKTKPDNKVLESLTVKENDENVKSGDEGVSA